MLLQYKFHNALHLAPVLADALRHALSHYAQQHRPDVIVLVPQLDERTAERGFNHLRLLMQQISLRDIWREAVPTYAPDAIIRLHHERLQIHVKPDMRRKQVKNAFTVADKKLFENTHVLLIDDIITTGATLNEIARVLKNAGARQVDNVVIGNRTRVKVVKNKVAPPFRQAEFDIIFGEGISREGSVVDLATEMEIFAKSGAWYSYKETRIGQGRENVKEYLRKNPQLTEELETRIRESAMGKLLAMPESPESAEEAAETE